MHYNVGYTASLTDLGEFGVVLIFSGLVTCGHRILSLCLCCCVYKMEEVILPALIERTRNQACTALHCLCLCHEHPRLASLLSLDVRCGPLCIPSAFGSLTGQVLSSFFDANVCRENPQSPPPYSFSSLCQRLQRAKWEIDQAKHTSSAGYVLMAVVFDHFGIHF